jgi:hypothetical protein
MCSPVLCMDLRVVSERCEFLCFLFLFNCVTCVPAVCLCVVVSEKTYKNGPRHEWTPPISVLTHEFLDTPAIFPSLHLTVCVTSSVRITCGLAVVCVFSPGDALSFLVFLFGGRPRGFAKRTSEATLGGGANLSSDSSCLKKRGRWSCV